MNDLEFLKRCGIASDSPDAELALQLRLVLAQQLSELKPEDVTPDMTCETLMQGIRGFDGAPDMLEVVMAMEELTGKDIPDYAAAHMINPSQKTQTTIRQLLSNWMEVLEKLNAGESFPPRRLTFWTDKRWYHWAAWGLPILGIAALAASLIVWRFISDEEFILRFVPIVMAPLGIWLGIRLWKWHRVTLDRMRFEHKYRAVLYIHGTTGVLLEPYNFMDYGGWDFADAATAAKRAGEIAAFLNLPLEFPSAKNFILFRGWNPVAWDKVATMPFFLELSSFCEKCKTAGFSAEVDTLLDTIRGLSWFKFLAEAVVKFEAALPQDALPAERKTLLKMMEQTNDRVDAYFKFLQACEIQSGTLGAYQARKLRKLWAAGSCRLTEDEVTADMRLGELAPQWFPPDDNDWDLHEEKVLAWGIVLGKDYDILSDLKPQPEWTLGELVRKFSDSLKIKMKQNSAPKIKPWLEYVVSLIFALVLSFLFNAGYSLNNSWSWKIWALILLVLLIMLLASILWVKYKKRGNQ